MFHHLILSVFFIFITITSIQSAESPAYSNNYEVISLVPTPNKITILAKYTANETFFSNPQNPIILHLKIQIFFQSDNQLRVLIKDAFHKRWEIPEEEPYPHDRESYYLYNSSTAVYAIEIEKLPFSFKIMRNSTKEILFNTKNFDFICSDRYLEFSSILPSENIFGIGERVHEFKLKFPGVYTIWNRDLAGVIDDAEKGALNTYGLYPLYLMREKEGFFHLVYLRNSNGMDVFLNNTVIMVDNGFYEETITYKLTGGVIDLKFFIGGDDKSPEEVVKMYHEYLGGYTMQPFWSFGFHQCRWGYLNLEMLNQTLFNYHTYGMPLDTIWMDIDYMEDHAIFTIDETRYDLTVMDYLLNELYQKKLVLIIDPGVAIRTEYMPYIEGIKRDVFIKDSNNDPLVSCVWPGQTHFPDFMNPETQDYWSDMFEILYEKVKFAGIWLDMNELSNFVDGDVGKGECGLKNPHEKDEKLNRLYDAYRLLLNSFHGSPNFDEINYDPIDVYSETLLALNLTTTPNNEAAAAAFKCDYSPLDYFYVYNPGNSHLDSNAVCLNGEHNDGTIEYDVHNFNGFFESINTYNYLKDRLNHQQPFILSRSTTLGSGKYTTHWTGDNVSTFKWMKLSIAGLINFNMFGIPNVGADICGFGGDTNEELCSRWMQLGALYPFARNHNTLGAIDQDPFAFGPTLVETSMVSLKFRYSILKYYYSLFVKNHGAGTVMRPLFFEFPEDLNTYNDDVLESEFLLGKELLVTPVLTENTRYIKAYFPDNDTIWYEIHSGEDFEGGQNHYIMNNLNETAPVFLRSGKSIYRQNVEKVNRTNDLDNVFYLSAAFKGLSSKGQIMACEDYSNFSTLEKCLKGDCFMNIEFLLIKNENSTALKINFIADKGVNSYDDIYLSGVELYGVDENISNSNGEVVIEKMNLINEAFRRKKTFGKAVKKEKIIKIDFGTNIPLGPNETLFIKF